MEKFPLIKNSFTLCWVKIAFNWRWLETDDWQKNCSLEIWTSGNCNFLFLGISNVARPGSFFCLDNFFKMFFDNFSSNHFRSEISELRNNLWITRSSGSNPAIKSVDWPLLLFYQFFMKVSRKFSNLKKTDKLLWQANWNEFFFQKLIKQNFHQSFQISPFFESSD